MCETEEIKCGVCLDIIEDKKAAVLNPCNHKYHEKCIMKWLTKEQVKCPVCRKAPSKVMNSSGEKMADMLIHQLKCILMRIDEIIKEFLSIEKLLTKNTKGNPLEKEKEMLQRYQKENKKI